MSLTTGRGPLSARPAGRFSAPMPGAVTYMEPHRRRVRGVKDGVTVVDCERALLIHRPGSPPTYAFPVGEVDGVASHPDDDAAGFVTVAWDAVDAWFEEDEQVFVHPRSPYTRADALRSNRSVRVELDGVVLADACSPVMVFETGLPTRYYLSRTDVDFAHLIPTDTVTACPYKGTTSGYWSVRAGGTVHPDLAWSYDFPTRQLLPIAGMIAFYNEKVDVILDGQRLERPQTHFF